MEYQLSPEQEELRGVVRSLLADHARARDSYDGGPPFAEGLWARFASLGLTGLGGREDAGGSGGDLVDQIVVAEEVGRAVAAVPFLSSVIVSLPLLAEHAGDPRADELFREAAAGSKIVTTAFTGAGTANAPDAVTVDDGRLRGTLSVVLDGAAAHVVLLPVGDRVHVVPTDGPHVAVTDEPTLDRTRRVATILLDGVEATELAAPDPRGALGRARQRALVGLAAEATGSAGAALEMAAEYAGEREQFGTVIGTFQAVKHRLADMLVAVENARSATAFGTWAVCSGSEDAEIAAAAAKATATQNAVDVVGAAIQVHGGIAITWEHDLHLHLRRVKSCQMLLGDPNEHLELVAAALLD